MGRTVCIAAFLSLFTAPPAAARSRKDNSPAKNAPPLFLLADFPYQMWSRAGTKIHLVAFTPRMRPARHAEVRLGKRRLGFTDSDGTFVFSFKARPGWRGGVVQVRKRIGRVLHVGTLRFSAYRRTSAYAHQRAYLYTDRGVYRPGDTLRARVLAFELRDRYHPLAGKKAVVTLRSPWGVEVARQEVRLDDFGTGHVTLSLAELEPVRHTLSLRVGRARHHRSVKIARFKRPALEVRHTFRSWFTDRSANITGRIRLQDLMGRSPQGGTLRVEARAGKQLLAQRAFPLDGRAGYVVSFNHHAVARFARRVPVGQRLTLRIHAKRTGGATATSEPSLLHVATPYTAVIELDRDDYRSGSRVTALVKVTDPDDLPAASRRVRLVLGQTRRAWTRYTNARGVARFRFSAPKRPGKNVRLRAYLARSATPSASATFAVRDLGALESRLGKAQVVQRRWVPVSVTLSPGFTPLEKVLHCDVTDHSGAIVAGVKLRWTRRGGRWVARGRFRAPSWGTMLITLFGLGARDKVLRRLRRARKPLGPEAAGVLMDGQQVTVHPDEALRLQLRGVPSRARPGGNVQLDLTVRGPDGAPVDARVGAALVDANILALGDPLQEVPPVPYFYNPRLRVMSTTGSKILTWPVVARTWSCHRYDIALPPFTFAEGGPAKCLSGMGFGGSGSGGGGGVGVGGGSIPRFTLRQRFAATSYWAPSLTAKGGRLRDRIHLPDTISRQTLLVVASDKRGRVGVARRTITVLKPISVELDLPPVMIAGDELEIVGLVRNRTSRAQRLRIAARGQGVTVVSAPKTLWVAPGPPVPLRLRLRADHVGPARVEVRAWTGKRRDGLRRTLTVLPRGPEIRRTRSARARSGHPARFTLRRNNTDQALLATLAVDYPGVLPALGSIQHTLRHPSLGGDTLSSTFQAAALVLRHARRVGIPGNRRQALRRVLELGVRRILRAQLHSGAFAYWRLGRSDVSHTAYVLETLLDIRAAGVPVGDRALRKAAWYLLTHRAADGLWDVSRLSRWEGRREAVRTGLSAEIFRAVARASHLKCHYQPNTRLVAVARRMEGLVRTSRDPRTVAAALEGLYALIQRCTGLPAPRRAAQRAARGLVARRGRVRRRLTPHQRSLLIRGAQRLLGMRRRRHWEPSWFSAWGGNLEANAAAIRVLHRLDRHRYRAAIRRGVQYLVERRASWGEWHNERGTAAALRALLEVADAARPETRGAALEVWVNQKRIRRVPLDPSNPWAAAAALSRVRLTPSLVSGANHIEVRTSGAIPVPVRLLTRRWIAASKRPQPTITLQAPARVKLGARFRASIRVTVPPHQPGLRVTLALPTSVELDVGALGKGAALGSPLRVQTTGRVLQFSFLGKPGPHRIHLPLRATRRGRSAFSAPTTAPLKGPPAPPGAARRTLTVH